MDSDSCAFCGPLNDYPAKTSLLQFIMKMITQLEELLVEAVQVELEQEELVLLQLQTLEEVV